MTDTPRSNAVSPVGNMGSGGPDRTSQEQVNKSIGMCRLHGLHSTEVTLRTLYAHLNKKYDDIGEMYIQKAELEARLLDVSKREAAMIARYDAKLEATEARAEAAEARLKEGAAILDRAVNGVWRDGDLELARAFLASMVDKP